MATTTRTRKARTADTAPKGLPRDLDESDVIADAQRMADELARREAAADAYAAQVMAEVEGEEMPKQKSQRGSSKAAPVQQPETAAAAAPAPRKGRTRKASTKAAPAQPQQPAQAVKAEKPAQTPKLNQAEMIIAFLAAHPDEEFTPHAISVAITPEGRKRLGLRDACARLAKAGKVAQTSDKPLKYKIA